MNGDTQGMRQLTYREAVREAMREAMHKDARVFLMGEDVGRYGGCFAVSKGLLEEFGPERIRDTPLSESAFVGAGIGAALGGMRPIVEIMTINFSLLAADQILNNAATYLRYVRGPVQCPAGDPHGYRWGQATGSAALAQPGRLVRAYSRDQGADPSDTRRCTWHVVDST